MDGRGALRPAPADAGAPAVAPPVTLAADATPARVLVVDDQPVNLRLAEAALAPGGHDVLLAGDPADALAQVAAEPVDLVLLDLRMPGMDGYELCRRLRELPHMAHVPIVVVTGAEDANKTQALMAGADDFVRKPFDTTELQARVGSLVRIKRYQDLITAQADELAEVNAVLEGKVQAQVAELERLGRLRRFLAPQVAELVVAEGAHSLLEAHRREVSVMCCDVRGINATAAAVEPEEILVALADLHAVLGPLVSRHAATVGHVSGDRVMVIFNDPMPCDHPARRAVELAVHLRSAIDPLRERWRRRGYELGVGVGLAYGFATLGVIGFEQRQDYTAIGSVVTAATALSRQAADGEVLMTERVADEVHGFVDAEEWAPTDVAERSPSTAWRVLDVRAGHGGDRTPHTEPATAAPTDTWFGVLGPMEIVHRSRSVELRPGKERSLLALLLVHANHTVSTDRILTELWRDAPVESALAGLRVYVSRLRKAFVAVGADEVLLTDPPGYRVTVARHQLDTAAFAGLADEGRAALRNGDPAAALPCFDAALRLWRGPSFSDALTAPSVRAESSRLAEARIDVLEDAMGARLELGEHIALLPELEALAAAHPYRERLCSHRIVALYRAGRQMDALQVYRALKETLSDVLGIEPLPQLAELERSILKHEAVLQWGAT